LKRSEGRVEKEKEKKRRKRKSKAKQRRTRRTELTRGCLTYMSMT
jgi:hypothetical protein